MRVCEFVLTIFAAIKSIIRICSSRFYLLSTVSFMNRQARAEKDDMARRMTFRKWTVTFFILSILSHPAPLSITSLLCTTLAVVVALIVFGGPNKKQCDLSPSILPSASSVTVSDSCCASFATLSSSRSSSPLSSWVLAEEHTLSKISGY